MLEILTPLSKVHRVSRKIDPSNFVANPGLWADLQTDGTLENMTTSTPSVNCKMVITSASDNVYESHDVEVGRISTLETPEGIRCRVDEEGYVDSVNVAIGGDLMVSVDAGNEGKLAVLADITQTGDYAIVARVEEFDATNNILTFVTVSPRTVTKS